MTTSSGMSFLAALHSAPASNKRSPSGWISSQPPHAAMRQRHAERQADLRAGAERLARMAIWLVKIPQLVSPILERVRGQDPILILDHVPKLASESRQRDRHAFPVLTRLSGPCGE